MHSTWCRAPLRPPSSRKSRHDTLRAAHVTRTSPRHGTHVRAPHVGVYPQSCIVPTVTCISGEREAALRAHGAAGGGRPTTSHTAARNRASGPLGRIQKMPRRRECLSYAV
eukprot:6505137-Prymnesium_polylepis.1